MRQTDLLVGDVICFSNGVMNLVLERDTVFDHLGRRDNIRYLNLRTGVSSPWLGVGLANPVRGEVIRGRETVWAGDEGLPNNLSPDFLTACDGGK